MRLENDEFHCSECQYFTLKSQTQTAFEVFQTTDNQNGIYQELVFANRKWELRQTDQAIGTPGVTRLMFLIFSWHVQF